MLQQLALTSKLPTGTILPFTSTLNSAGGVPLMLTTAH
jgi:hypothetical protein